MESPPQRPPRRARARRAPIFRRVATQIAIVIASLAFLLAADGAYVVLELRPALTEAADSLRKATDALREGGTERARRAVEAARTRVGEATDLVQHPGLVIASHLPGLRRDARALIGLANASARVALAGSDGVRAAEAVGLDDEGIAASVYTDGRVNLDALEDALASATTATQLLTDAEGILDAVGAPRSSLLQDAVTEARAEVAEAASMARHGSLLFRSLPPLLGGDGARRYLLAFQALGEARATGGLVGLQGVLRAEDGRVRLTSLGPPRERGLLSIRADVPAPAWFRSSYSNQAATQQWQQANVSPNFPAAAEVLLEMYESATSVRLDGVVAMDPVALEQLMAGLEPIKAPGLEVALTENNASEVILEDSYLAFSDPDSHDDYTSAVVRAFWDRVRAGEVEITDTARGLVDAVEGQHLKVHVRDPEVKGPLDALGIDGDYRDFGPNVQLAFHNNYGVNKVDYYLRRAIDTRVRLEEDGDARVTTTVTLDNAAPAGPANMLLGLEAKPPGLNRMMFNVLAPPGAQFDEMSIDGALRRPFIYEDDGHPVAWAVIDVPPDDRSTVTTAYTVPGAAVRTGNSLSFAMSLIPQATAVAEEFTLAIAGPQGMHVGSVSEASGTGRRVRAAGTLSEPKTVRVVYRLP